MIGCKIALRQSAVGLTPPCVTVPQYPRPGYGGFGHGL